MDKFKIKKKKEKRKKKKKRSRNMFVHEWPTTSPYSSCQVYLKYWILQFLLSAYHPGY